MSDERNVAHDKKVAAEKAKAAGGVGVDAAANVNGDGQYTTEHHQKHPPKPGKKSPQEDGAAEG